MTELSDIFTDPCKNCDGTADECFYCEWVAWPFRELDPVTDNEEVDISKCDNCSIGCMSYPGETDVICPRDLKEEISALWPERIRHLKDDLTEQNLDNQILRRGG